MWYRLVASSVSLSKKRVSRSDATNSKCLKHTTGEMHFVRSAERNCKVGVTEVQGGETEKCAVGAMVVIERPCDCQLCGPRDLVRPP